MMHQVDPQWDPPMVLEFLKMTIRTAIAGKIGDQRKFLKQNLKELEEELNQMEDLKMIAIKETDT
jgi:hypothetical protein